MKMIRFSSPFFGTDDAGNHRALFEAGKDYPADNEEARRCVARGIAAEVEVPDPEPEPEPKPEPETVESVTVQDAATAGDQTAAAPAAAPAAATTSKKK